MKLNQCSSFIPSNGIYGPCRDGHVQTAVCAGICADTLIPTCCNEELCEKLYEPFGGKPAANMLATKEEGDE